MLPLKREDYKAIKHMNKSTMERYLNGIYQRGYSDGAKDIAQEQEAERNKALAQQSEAAEPAGGVQP